MKKIFIFVFLATAMAIASAQSNKKNTGKFTATGKNISVSYSLPPSAGTATFTLTNQSGTALKSGENFMVELPSISGYRYDLANVQKNNGFGSTLSSSVLVINKDYNPGEKLSFSCPVVPVATPLESNPRLNFIRK